MKLAETIFISAVLCVSFIDAIDDLMPADSPKTQIWNTIPKQVKKHSIFQAIENSDSLTHADGDVDEGLSAADENDDERVESRGSITSPEQNNNTHGTENVDDEENGKVSPKEGGINVQAKKFDDQSHEEPGFGENYNQDEGKGYNDGIEDEANNIADIDVNDGEDQANVGNLNTDDEWGKEVHEDD